MKGLEINLTIAPITTPHRFITDVTFLDHANFASHEAESHGSRTLEAFREADT